MLGKKYVANAVRREVLAALKQLQQEALHRPEELIPTRGICLTLRDRVPYERNGCVWYLLEEAFEELGLCRGYPLGLEAYREDSRNGTFWAGNSLTARRKLIADVILLWEQDLGV